MTPGTIPIGYLDPNNYFGYEMEARQNNDGLCHWFIHHVVIPRTWGGGIPSSRLHPDGHPELVAMINERTRFWILQGGRDWDYKLLMYDYHRIVVPPQRQIRAPTSRPHRRPPRAGPHAEPAGAILLLA